MSEKDSPLSSDKNTNTGTKATNTTPILKKKSDSPDENTHGYFIPAVMAVVLGIIIVATFDSKEFNNFVDGAVSTDQVEAVTPDKNERLSTRTDSVDKSTATTVTTGMIETPAETQPSNTKSSSDNTPSSETVASLENHAAHSGRQNYYVHPYALPMPHRRSDWPQKAYSQMMQERHRAYDETMQARQQHIKKMHGYRVAVLKRIEQDRQDMHKRMQELEQDRQRRRDQLMNWMEQEDRRSASQPI